MWYVYIIRSVKYKYKYIGSTNDLERRLREHNNGMCDASSPYKPFEIEAHIAVKDKAIAVALEKYFKSGSGAAFLKKHIL